MVLKNRGLQRHGLTAVMYRGFETVKSPGNIPLASKLSEKVMASGNVLRV